MNVLVLVGSLRAGSYNARLAEAAVATLPDDVEVTCFDRLAELPFYSEDLDTGEVPAVVTDLRRAITDADALLIATPEYNGSVPAVIKNAVDWGSRPRGAAALAGKPVAVIAASGSPRAAQWAREDLVRVLTVAQARPVETTVGVGTAHQHFGETGLVAVEVEQALRELTGHLVTQVPAAA